jgi:tetratricopeptide (TPR) repeat protein
MKNTELTTVTTYQKPLSDPNPHSDPIPQSITKKSVLILFIFALAFRMIYLIQSTENPLFGVPVVDAIVYVRWAEKMVDGIWLWDRVDNYLPIYPAFLAVQQIVFGASPFVNKILQSIMGSFTAVLMAQVAARAWNRQVGLITGYLLATYWMLVIFGAEKYAETFSIFFQSLTLWLLVRYSQHIWVIFAAGITFALSAGVRANLFLVLPFVMAWLVWRNWNHRRIAFKAAVLFSLGTVLIIGPIVVRNYQISGSPMLRAQTSWNLYSGLSPEYEGLHPPVGISFLKYMRMPDQVGAFKEKAVEQYWYQRSKDVIRENPSGVALNFLRHLVIFVNAREWSQEFDVYAYRSYSKVLSLPWTGFWLIGPFGLLGLALTRRLSENQKLVLLYTIIGILSIVPFKASDRYRLPSAVLLAIFAALSLWFFYQWIKSTNLRALFASLPVLALLCLFCWPDWQNIANRKSSRHDYFLGLHYEDSGRNDFAIRAYEKSMNYFSWDPDSPHRIGRILIEQKNPNLGMQYLREALRREAEFPEAINAIAYIYLQRGDLDAAEKELNNSLELAPINTEALMLMANIQHRKGQLGAEIALLKKAVTHLGGQKSAMLLALRLNEAGNLKGALELYDMVIKSRDAAKQVRLSATMRAGMIHARLNYDAAEARRYWLLIVREFNDFTFFSAQASFLLGDLDEKSFREMMGDSPEGQVTAEYIIALHHQLNGNTASAIQAYRRCLQLDIGDHTFGQDSPRTWAREDLRDIIEGGAKIKKVF